MTETDSAQSSLDKPNEEFFRNPFALQASFGCVSQRKASHQQLALFHSFSD